MTTRYVDGTSGNDAWDGLAPAWDGVHGPKKTLNGAEDTPVQAGDLVYVRPGVYYERLTCDVDGSSGSPIEYRGDCDGSVWPGGGEVRITALNATGTSISQSSCIYTVTARYWRIFRDLALSHGSVAPIHGCFLDSIFEGLYIFGAYNAGSAVTICFLAGSARITFRNCLVMSYGTMTYGGSFDTTSNAQHLVENCIFLGGRNSYTLNMRGGNSTIRNCLFLGGYYSIYVYGLYAGETVAINNCQFIGSGTAMRAQTLGQILEDYNNIYGVNTARTNVDVGANSISIPGTFDAHLLFEMLTSGKLFSFFDHGTDSGVKERPSLNPPATDLRGIGQLGAARDWGPLEYDDSLGIGGGGGGGPIIGSRIIRGLGAL